MRLHLLVPADLDDPDRPSGGNVYGQRIRDGLRQRGHDVVQISEAGTVTSLPNGETVLVDGLIATSAPKVLLSQTGRLDLVLLIHMPPGAELGTRVPRAVPELLRRARAVLTTSAWTARALEHEATVAEPGTDPAPIAPGTDGATSLLTVGSLTAAKGHDVLVTALRRLEDLPWRCRIIGSHTRDPACAERLREMLTDRITAPGPYSGPQLAEAYAAADLLVVPSRVESYGMVVTEALARAIPVLAADTGGVREALGEAALAELVVEPGDPSALAAALRRWLTDPALRDTARLRALGRRATLPTWSRTLDVVETVLTRRPETSR